MYEQIKAPIEKELHLFNQRFQSLIESDFPLIQSISDHVFQTKGKQIRPILVLLTYRLFNKNPNDLAYLSASLVEIMHAASLMHDDVVDNADQRRGSNSTRFLFGNKTAVLAGDYLLSNAILKAHTPEDQKLMLLLVDVVKKMSEGELLQIEYTANPQITEAIYYQIIERKTAALFSCCCQCGALAANANMEQLKKITLMGQHLGIAFQIKDDILDFKQDVNCGKKYANDLRERKITLPLLHYLNGVSLNEQKEIWNCLQKEELSEIEIHTILTKVTTSDALSFANEQAKKHTQKALVYLEELGAKHDTTALRLLINYIA
ncbi:MAG: polyprenyl synthetase family protein [Bacteroidales bacterium]